MGTIDKKDLESDPALQFLPDDLSEATVNDIEFTIPITSIHNETSSEAPFLGALTSYREKKNN